MNFAYFIFTLVLIFHDTLGVSIANYLNSGMDLSLSGVVYWLVGLLISWLLS